jgi:hypothetical protein
MTTTTMPDERLSDLTGLGERSDNDRHYFAEITNVDDWDAAWPKGSRPVPFDPSQHTPAQRRVFITLQLTCTKADGSTYTLDQAEVTSGSKHKVTLGSLDALGVSTRSQLRGLRGKYAEVQRVPTGQTYLSKSGARAGQTVDEVAFKFLRLFDSADECAAAEREFYTPKSGGTGRNVPQPIEQPAIDEAGRAALLQTLPTIWTAIKAQPGAEQVLAGILAGNPAYAAHGITMQSGEVADIINPIPF